MCEYADLIWAGILIFQVPVLILCAIQILLLIKLENEED